MKTKLIGIGLVLIAVATLIIGNPLPAQASVCSVSALPSLSTVTPGTTFDVSIVINTDSPARGFQFAVTWDPSKVQCNSVTKGTYFDAFAAANNGDVFYLPANALADNTAGRFPKNTNTIPSGSATCQNVSLTGANGPNGTYLGPTGSGTAFILHMTALSTASGTVSFVLNNIILGDNSANTADMHPTVNNGQVNIVVPNPTITSIFPATATYGSSLNISGTNFVAGATTVTFNNISGSSVSVTDGQHLSVIVPNLGSSNLSNVSVQVTNAGGNATNTGFNYSASAVPVVYHPMVTAGISHTAGLKAGGTVFATGDNRFGQCNVASWTGITQIAAGGYFTVGLKADGTVVATGDDRFGQCDVSSWTGIVQVTAGFDNTIGLKSDGTVVAAGDDYFGQCDVSSWKGITQIASGYFYTVGLKSDGTVIAAGDDSDGQYTGISAWTDITQVVAGDQTVGLKSDGTVVAVSWNGDGRCNVSGWTGITQVAAGLSQTMGLKSDGTVVATGDDTKGQCDTNSWTNIIQVVSGGYQTVGLNADGTVVATGDNRYGECNVGSWNLRTLVTNTAVNSSANPNIINLTVTLTATVNPIPNGGNVQFLDNGANLGNAVTVDGFGHAFLTTSALAFGSHTITAMYNGDADFAPSTGSIIQVITGPRWDINNDHVCNVLDLISVGGAIGESGTPGWIPQDVNMDGVVNLIDLLLIGNNMGNTW